MRTCMLDGEKLTTKELLHQTLAAELDLPAWYGHNLDALYDCLTEKSEEVQIVCSHLEEMEAALGRYATALQQVFKDAAKENPRVEVLFKK